MSNVISEKNIFCRQQAWAPGSPVQSENTGLTTRKFSGSNAENRSFWTGTAREFSGWFFGSPVPVESENRVPIPGRQKSLKNENFNFDHRK